MKKPVSDSWQAFVVPVRARIASKTVLLQKNEILSYSPREGANCIKIKKPLSMLNSSYSPREGANCIKKNDTKKKSADKLQSP